MDENEKKTETENEIGDGGGTETSQNAGEAATNDFLNDPAVIAYIEKQIAEGIQKALKGASPKSNTANPTEQEKKSFEKMTYKERLNLFKTNPMAYQKLSKGVN